MGISDTHFSVIAIETTGDSSEDRICEVAVANIEDLQIKETFATLIDPDRDLGDVARHGLQPEDIYGAPVFNDVAGDIIKRIKHTVLVAHNAPLITKLLEREFAFADIPIPRQPHVCSRRLAAEILKTPETNLELDQICRLMGVEKLHIYSARSDVLMTAEILLSSIRRLRPSEVSALPGFWSPASFQFRWPHVPTTARTKGRPKIISKPTAAGTVHALFRQAERLPDSAPSSSKIAPYIEILDQALRDRTIQSGEVQELACEAGSLGLSEAEIDQAHHEYFRNLLRLATQDGVLTEFEKKDLNEVRQILGISLTQFQLMVDEILSHSSTETLASKLPLIDVAGKSVCFTGSLEGQVDGQATSTLRAEELAEERGMRIEKFVTDKLDYLVCGNEKSDQEKVRTARELGIEVIAEPVFWRMLGAQTEHIVSYRRSKE